MDRCADALIPSISINESQVSEELAYYAIITNEEQFLIARSGGASGRYNLISGSANFSEFRQQRARLFQETGYDASSQESQRIVTSSVPPEATEAWLRCILGRSQILVFAEDINEDGLTLFIRADYGNVTDVSIVNATLTLGGTSQTDMTEDFAILPTAGEFEDRIQIVRTGGESVRFTLRAPPFSAGFYLPSVQADSTPIQGCDLERQFIDALGVDIGGPDALRPYDLGVAPVTVLNGQISGEDDDYFRIQLPECPGLSAFEVRLSGLQQSTYLVVQGDSETERLTIHNSGGIPRFAQSDIIVRIQARDGPTPYQLDISPLR